MGQTSIPMTGPMTGPIAGPIAGVVGYPVAHSLSPKVHRYWLDLFGLSGSYIAHPIHPVEFQHEMRRLLGDVGWVGMNVTIPHKETACAFVDSLNTDARRLGAVNTILRQGTGRIEGRNTDLYGFKTNLETALEWGGVAREKAVVLGAGGAARAVVAAFQDWGFKRIVIVNRSPDRAATLARDLSLEEVEIITLDKAAAALTDANLLVNTTSLGMAGQPDLPLALDVLPLSALVTDIVYKPLRTALLARAQARGNPTVDGLGMLLHQAVPGFMEWFNPPEPPPVDAALRTLVLAGIE